MTIYRLAVDGMGGDNAPHAIVGGVCRAAEAGNVEILLTGDEEILRQELDKHPKVSQHVEIVHAADAIPMDAKPKEILIPPWSKLLNWSLLVVLMR